MNCDVLKIRAIDKLNGGIHLVQEIRWDEAGFIHEIELENGYCFFSNTGTLKHLDLRVEDQDDNCVYFTSL